MIRHLCSLLLVVMLACLCGAAAAQAHDSEARRITQQPPYQGYRVEQPPGRGGDGFDERPGERVEGAGSRDSARSRTQPPPQRTSGPGSRVDRSRGGGGGRSGGGSLPSWVGGLFEVIAWIVVIVGGLTALFFIVKALIGMKWKRKSKKPGSRSKRKKTTTSETEAAPEAIEEVEAQVFEDALAVAEREYREALAREDFAAATLLGYRIFWLRAGWAGCVQEEDVRTWRDALRMVRATETRRAVRELLPMVERVRYAEYRPARNEFQSWADTLGQIQPAGVLS